ncbi:NAD(P)H-hydrate epimerase, partial [Candidatus Bathyarchaeota archaeon]|nr:NAD(P)H-hydrate epimerase [Candidatus Bathyarchaeota archaeon]
MTITNTEMRALELNSEYFGVSKLQLMENAGQSVATEIASRFKPDKTRIVVFCGSGGNGGDGFVAARHLACLGFKVEVILAGGPVGIRNDETRRNLAALQALKNTVTLHEVYDSSRIPNVKAEVVVDAL